MPKHSFLFKNYTFVNCCFDDLETASTKDLTTATIAIVEFSLLTQEPTPIALAPAAKAIGAVVVVRPDAVITGIETFLVNSIVLDIET